MTLKIKRRLGTPKYNIEHFTGAALADPIPALHIPGIRKDAIGF